MLFVPPVLPPGLPGSKSQPLLRTAACRHAAAGAAAERAETELIRESASQYLELPSIVVV